MMLLILTEMGRRELPIGFVAGFFFATVAIIMGVQTYNNYRAGFMFYIQSEKIHRDKKPAKFKILFILNSIAVLFLTSASIYAFLA